MSILSAQTTLLSTCSRLRELIGVAVVIANNWRYTGQLWSEAADVEVSAAPSGLNGQCLLEEFSSKDVDT